MTSSFSALNRALNVYNRGFRRQFLDKIFERFITIHQHDNVFYWLRLNLTLFQTCEFFCKLLFIEVSSGDHALVCLKAEMERTEYDVI